MAGGHVSFCLECNLNGFYTCPGAASSPVASESIVNNLRLHVNTYIAVVEEFASWAFTGVVSTPSNALWSADERGNFRIRLQDDAHIMFLTYYEQPNLLQRSWMPLLHTTASWLAYTIFRSNFGDSTSQLLY
jgi:hypothetical protein